MSKGAQGPALWPPVVSAVSEQAAWPQGITCLALTARSGT